MVIAGAGFAGLAAAHALRKAPVRTVLVDQHNYHTFLPMLYQVAASMIDVAEVARPTRGVIRGIRNAEFRLARVTGVDLDGRWLKTDKGPLPYDYLVLALGSTTQFFGNASAIQRAMGMKDLEEALEVRSRILTQFERAEFAVDPRERKQLLSFVIVGGGPTGVETAGALSELVDYSIRRDFKGREVGEVSITLVEGSPALLGPFEPRLRDAAKKVLERRGVRVILNTHVKEVREGSVLLDNGEELPAASVVWAAGVKAVEVDGVDAAYKGRQQTVQVQPTLQLAGRPEVFVVGDMAGVKSGERQLPMLAQVAVQGATQAGRNIAALVEGRPAQEFKYHDKGFMATIGRFNAVVQSGRLRLTGFTAWVAWLGLHLVYLDSFRSKLAVVIDWAWVYVLRDRPVRLILGGRERSAAPAEPGLTPAPR